MELGQKPKSNKELELDKQIGRLYYGSVNAHAHNATVTDRSRISAKAVGAKPVAKKGYPYVSTRVTFKESYRC